MFVIGVIGDRFHTFREIAYKKGFPRRTLWCRPPWRIWFSLCPIRPKFFFGRRCAAGRRSARRARPESWPAVGGLGQQRARPPAGAGSGERARAACMGLREAAVGALRPNGSAGSTGGGRACWTWTCGGAGGRVAGRRRAWSRRGAGRCSVTAGSSSSAAVVEAAARSRRCSAPELTRDGRPSRRALVARQKFSTTARARNCLKADLQLTKTLAFSQG